MFQSTTNLRARVCIIQTGLSFDTDRNLAWPPAAEEFLKRIHKLSLSIALVGPKPARKFGSKKTIHFFDRHEVIGLKILSSSRSHNLELRLLNKRAHDWTRLRTEACIVVGTHGIWPVPFEGWISPGTLSINSLLRWVQQYRWLPGREFAFLGSSNQNLRAASLLLDRGAKSCYVIEENNALKCWRAHHDRFVAKGGRVLSAHKILRTEQDKQSLKKIFLQNDKGTLVIAADTLVLGYENDHALNSPEQWKSGLFYLQRRYGPYDAWADEEISLEECDWNEVYWRLVKFLRLSDRQAAETAISQLKISRKSMLEYRRQEIATFGRSFQYSGKILQRDSLEKLQASRSVPRSFVSKKPLASLECLENIACRACADACPESAISIKAITDQPQLLEEKCTGCGACVAACPAGVAVMIKEDPQLQKANYFFPDDGKDLWKPGKQVQLLSRLGENLGTGRIANQASSFEHGLHRVIEIEASNIYTWEARGFSKPQEELFDNAPTQLKRGWVRLNGVRRLCPLHVPFTVATGQLGIRRFQDALFCSDASCNRCEIQVNGKPMLGCTTLVEEGQEIIFPESLAQSDKQILCPCKNVEKAFYETALRDCGSEKIARELTGLGEGQCHGAWCLNSSCFNASGRPRFQGYENTPWRDLWPSDIGDLL